MLRNLLLGKFPRKLAVVPAEPETLYQCLERLGALRASVYLYREERFFISAVQDFNEYLEPLELPADVDDATLGEALIDRLRAFDPISPLKLTVLNGDSSPEPVVDFSMFPSGSIVFWRNRSVDRPAFSCHTNLRFTIR